MTDKTATLIDALPAAKELPAAVAALPDADQAKIARIIDGPAPPPRPMVSSDLAAAYDTLDDRAKLRISDDVTRETERANRLAARHADVSDQ